MKLIIWHLPNSILYELMTNFMSFRYVPVFNLKNIQIFTKNCEIGHFVSEK